MDEPIEKRYKILIVDDEKDNIDGFLGAFGDQFVLLTATSGKDALELIQQDKAIGVVVTDQRMAGMTGVELLATVKVLAPRSCGS